MLGGVWVEAREQAGHQPVQCAVVGGLLQKPTVCGGHQVLRTRVGTHTGRDTGQTDGGALGPAGEGFMLRKRTPLKRVWRCVVRYIVSGTRSMDCIYTALF